MDKSNSSIPLKYQERFYLKRIDEEPLEISLDVRNAIVKALATGTRYVQIGKYTIMVNSIKSIDPMYGQKNIPPRPHEKLKEVPGGNHGSIKMVIANQDELDEWDSLFGSKRLSDALSS